MKTTTKVAIGAAVLIAGAFVFVWIALDALVKNTGGPPRKRRDA